MAKPIGTLGTIPTLTVGGRVFTDLDTLITLVAKCSGNQSTLRKSGAQAGAGYPVTALKTLNIYALRIIPTGATAGGFIGQSDSDSGLSASSALTNPIYFGTESSVATSDILQASGANTITEMAGNPLGKVLAGKYLTIDANSAGLFVWAFGYET